MNSGKPKDGDVYVEKRRGGWVVFSVLAMLALAFVIITPIKEELYCDKSANSCIVTSDYIMRRSQIRLVNYDGVTGAVVVTNHLSWPTTHNIALTISGGLLERMTVFVSSSSFYGRHKRRAEFLNQQFASQAETIRLETRDDTIFFIIFGIIAAGLAVTFAIFVPVSKELYCSKSANSCVAIKRYMTGRRKETRVADYEQVTGAVVERMVPGDDKSPIHCVFLTLSGGGKVVFGVPVNSSKAKRRADWLNSKFAEQAESIRIKIGIWL
ncbi:MAG: hypothetical protein FWF01_02195 [Alphaproteobacteria bacterium]|nr:hypothetical protein [Alphaproteobacteria bacterium]